MPPCHVTTAPNRCRPPWKRISATCAVNSRIHERGPFEEEADLDWWNDGLDALQANQLQRAEKIFKKLALAQPEHFDGYYGLAQVYQRQQLLPQAILFA